LAAASTGLAGTFYVSPTGSDLAAGDATHPWLTLQKAANVVTGGDTVNVLPGNYTGFDLARSGKPDRQITFLAQPGVFITANNPSTPDGINLEGASYVTIDGFNASGRGRAGIRSVCNNGVVLRNNTCDSNATWGILTGFSSDLLIENNICSRSGTQHGIYIGNSSDNITLRRNVCWGNYGCGIHMNGDINTTWPGHTIDGLMQNVLVEGNILYGNGSGGGASINGDGVQDSIIRNNLIYNAYNNSGIALYDGDGSAGPKNDLVQNNTVLMASTGGWCLNISSPAGANYAYNNILYNSHSWRGSIEYDRTTGLVSDYNVVMDRFSTDSAGSRIGLGAWRTATGQDAHSIIATPTALFVDPANNDYHLKGGSPAIDVGSTVNGAATDLRGVLRPIKNGTDIGAYEFILAGDANCDGAVRFADYQVLEANFGKAGADWAMGDFNDDRSVTFADYQLLESNFNLSLPEPASLTLLLAGAGMFLRRGQ
jgi:hypothetical protein